MRSTRFALFLPLVVAVLAAEPPAGEFTAKVVGITDGDTLTSLRADRTHVKVRLHGIDAPGSGQDFATRAKQAAADLAFGQAVTIRPLDTDRYGRTVAEVILPDGRSLNRELVRQGMAWWYRQYAPADRDLERLEAEARGARLGLWSQSSPIPPWEWRKGQGATTTAAVIGDRRSWLYHAPTCRGVAAMKPENRAEFPNAAAAEEAAYRRAGGLPVGYGLGQSASIPHIADEASS